MREWISVNDELPVEGVEVLAWEDCLYHVTFWTGDEWDAMGDITHWMPLPEPPEEQGE